MFEVPIRCSREAVRWIVRMLRPEKRELRHWIWESSAYRHDLKPRNGWVWELPNLEGEASWLTWEWRVQKARQMLHPESHEDMKDELCWVWLRGQAREKVCIVFGIKDKVSDVYKSSSNITKVVWGNEMDSVNEGSALAELFCEQCEKQWR